MQVPLKTGPSRSARRKARKRQLKRMGLLPGPGRKAPKDLGEMLASHEQPASRSLELEAAAPDEEPKSVEPSFLEVPVLPGDDLKIGDVLQYQLLEMWNGCPELSEIRQGRVIGWQDAEREVILEPYPDPAVHPLVSHLEAMQDEVTHDDNEGPGPSQGWRK